MTRIGCGSKGEVAMKIRIQVVIEAENGKPEKIEEIGLLERSSLRPEELGLTLAEAKALLRNMQQVVVTEQISEYLEQFKICPHCGLQRNKKGQHVIVYRTLFGKLNLVSPRLYDCSCQDQCRHSSSPLAQWVDDALRTGITVPGDQVCFIDVDGAEC